MSLYSTSEVCARVCETCPGEPVGELGIADYVLLSFVLVVSAGIGVFYMIKEYLASKSATSEDILMGGRDIGIFPIAMSLMASFMSAITVLGTPTEMYNNNTSYWISGLAMIPTVIITNHIFLPFYHGLNLASAYEYLERRFNHAVRVCASCLFVINMLLYMGVVLYAPSLALNAVTAIPLWGCIITIGVVCTFYTALGGLRAVVWTDTFQTFIVIAGLIAVVVRGAQQVGGINHIWNTADDGGRIFFLDWRPDPTVRHSVWALFFGAMVGQLTIYAANQTMIQRYLAIKEIHNSQKALYMSLPLTLVLQTLVCVVGLVIYACYAHCDPYIMGIVRARDQLLPLLVMDKLTFAPGLAGLFVSCLFSASLSSISSGLNALAIVILEDLLKPFWEWRRSHVSVKAQANIAKGLGFVCGGAIVGIAFLASLLGQTVLQTMLSIFGMVGGPLLGLFIAGIFFPFINSWGALAGLVVSTLVSFWTGVGAAVLLSIPQVQRVDTSACINRELLHTQCQFGNVTAANVTLPLSTTLTATTTTESTPLEADGEDLWIYQISYQLYALFAVVIFLIVSTIATFITSCCTGFNRPEDIDKTLVHKLVDRNCCYLPLSCKRVPREHTRDSSNGGVDAPWTVSEGKVNGLEHTEVDTKL